ncbi:MULTISPECIES: hypothetical protein [Gordonia]|uniref:DUF2946 domain-containing protein n=1 Tax=Gordonia amicalis TaxID=89053 RepID=A0AAE4R996_9ACTN|nr:MULTISPECIES: hypothetical protein [Gordonia]ATD72490.1 hypothetical protein CNO18_21705 [Gordonia sp. 1D]KAF0966949.1 hypothetical protein BPODLACK_04567 [Gordonia sp. YY1]MDJ0455244.1 hypothetical protein [Gordonia amicalis]MDV6309047.1 hypothetical protein [Gordonia amicalis]MDV6312700.1 hypothetical protein [Gordonia amicalis]
MTRHRARTVRRYRGLILPLALAVMLMHTVVAGPAEAESRAGAEGRAGSHSHAGHQTAAASSEPGMTHAAVMGEAPSMSGADCGDHDHGCVFTRAADIDLPTAALVLLVWAFLSLSAAARYRPARRGVVVLGRPPPWAIRSHLQLQVIRC